MVATYQENFGRGQELLSKEIGDNLNDQNTTDTYNIVRNTPVIYKLFLLSYLPQFHVPRGQHNRQGIESWMVLKLDPFSKELSQNIPSRENCREDHLHNI